MQPDGKVIAGGYLNPVNGAASAGVLRFNGDGSLDTSFQAGAQSEAATGTKPYVLALGLQGDGKVIVGGYFSTIGGVPCNNVARLNADGSLDMNFDAGGAGADGVVHSIAVQTDGKIILGGEFTTVNGVARAGVVRLRTDGSVDPQFTPGTGTAGSGHVNSVALAPDGSVIVGGTFTQFNGVARDGVVRLFGGDLPPVPVVTSSTTVSGQVGQAFTYQIAASNEPTSYTAAGLPPGLTLNPATGSISGTPTTAGTFPVTVSATNLGGAGTAPLTLTITPPTPVVTAAAGVSARAGQAFAYQIAASNEPTSYTAGGLPAGLNVNVTTGLISGTPTVAGTFTVSLGATNAGGTGNASLLLTVVPALPVVTLTADVPQVIAGSGNVGEFTLTRSGGDLSTPLMVAYMVKGSAVDGTDYVMLKGVRKIKAGKSTAKIKVKPVGDGAAPGTKRVVTLVLAPGDGYTVGTAAKVKVKIYGQ